MNGIKVIVMFNWLTSRLFPIWVPIRIVKFYKDLNNTKETFTHTIITYINLKNSKIKRKKYYFPFDSKMHYSIIHMLIDNNKEFFDNNLGAQNYLKRYFPEIYNLYYSGTI